MVKKRDKMNKKRKVKNIIHDPRNKLNDLSSVEWIQQTKSVWYSKPAPRDHLKNQHPATFAEEDIERLIKFFTKENQLVFDPFLGVASTLIACINTRRKGIGVELSSKWVDIAQKRINKILDQTKIDSEVWETSSPKCESPVKIIQGDTRDIIKKYPANVFDFIVTSPPYWSILTKANDHKSKEERIKKGLDTKYSENNFDLGNIIQYEDFRNELKKIWAECFRTLKKTKYMCVIITDFRHKDAFILYHSDITRDLESVGFSLKGITILVQDNKELYPYGYPYSFVSNIHHQYIIILQKVKT